MKIGIIGLGKLGLPLLCAFVKKNFEVFGYDINPDTVSTLRKKISTIKENGIQEVIDNDHIWSDRISDRLDKVFHTADILFVIVPTPSTSNGIFDRRYIEALLENINHLGASTDQKKLIVITSTVNPGDCNYFQQKFQSLNLVYSPEFIALGTVLRDMLNPDTCIIGANDPKFGKIIEGIYQKLYESTPSYHHLNFTCAEITKISINSFVTLKISYANMIGSYLYKLTNGNLDAVSATLDAIASDSRINKKYFKFGPGYGGPCFPRDNICLSKHLKDAEINAVLPNASDELNNWMVSFHAERLKNLSFKNIIYVGLSYKAESDFLEESFILKLHNNIKKDNINYYFIDEKISVYKGMVKLHSPNDVDLKNSLFIINYQTQNFNFLSDEYHVFNLWS